jgi:hypothetical protein
MGKAIENVWAIKPIQANGNRRGIEHNTVIVARTFLLLPCHRARIRKRRRALTRINRKMYFKKLLPQTFHKANVDVV